MPTEIETIDDTDRPPFRESAEELLAMWKAGDFKNLADAVQDCKALLYAVPPEHASYKPILQAILDEATAGLARIAAERELSDPYPVPRKKKGSNGAPAAKAAPKQAATRPALKKTAAPVAPKKKAPAKKAAPKKAPAAKAAPKKAPKKSAPKKAAPKKAAKKVAPKKKAAPKKAAPKKKAKGKR